MTALADPLACPAWCSEPHGTKDTLDPDLKQRQHSHCLLAAASGLTRVYVFQHDLWRPHQGWKRDESPYFLVHNSYGTYQVETAEQLAAFLPAVQLLAPHLVDLITQAATLCGIALPPEYRHG